MTGSSQRIGLLGGTFNPIHNGHLAAARQVGRRMEMDMVLLIPSFVPPHKTTEPVAPARHRMAMVELAVAGEPFLAACSIEVETGGRSYSIRTIRELKRDRPSASLFFIVGIDAFLEIHTWREAEKVIRECPFVVISRPGFSLDEAGRTAGAVPSISLVTDPGPILREEMRSDPPLIVLLTLDTPDISSTDIRSRARRGKSLAGLVPSPVEKYIRLHRLYKGVS